MERKGSPVRRRSSTSTESQPQEWRDLHNYAQTSPTPPVDRHGKQPNPRARSSVLKKQIYADIKSFPIVGGHYSQKKH